MKTPALLSAALLLLLVSGVPAARSREVETGGYSRLPVTVWVTNYQGTKTYNTYVVYGGIILGALKRLQSTTAFTFSFREDPDFGPIITHVNGLYENSKKRYFWKVILRSTNGSQRVVSGCVQPQGNDIIWLIYSYK